jgi:hypothetical protein
MNLNVIERDGVDCIQVLWYRDMWRAVVNMVMNLLALYMAGNFLLVKDYQLLRNNSVSQSYICFSKSDFLLKLKT